MKEAKSKGPSVKIYSTPTCMYCKLAKDYLKAKGVKFQDIDVSSDQTAAREMIGRTGQSGVPQIEINGKMIVGFDRAAIDRELGL